MARSPFDRPPQQDDPEADATEIDQWWPAQGPWGGRGRLSVLVVAGVLAALAVVVLALTFLGGEDSGAGTAAVGPPPVVLAGGDLGPGTRVALGGVDHDVAVGPFTPSTRGATAGSHLLLAPVVVRNPGTTPTANPLVAAGGLPVQVGVRGVPEAALSGPSALVCRNRTPTSPLAPPGAAYPGAEPGTCVLEARTTPGPPAATVPPGGEVRGILLSSPVPDVVTDTAPSVWVATGPGAYRRVG